MSEPGGADGSGRLRAYKNRGLDAEELRRRREEVGVQLRRQRREEQLFKRRNVGSDLADAELDDDDDDCDGDGGGGAGERPREKAPELSGALAGLGADDPAVRLGVARRLRRLLSNEPEPPVDAVLSSPGCLRHLMSLLADDAQPEAQFEAAWIVTNVCSGASEHTEAVVGAGAVPLLCRLATAGQRRQLREQSVWALANVAGDCADCRDAVLADEAAVPALADCLGDGEAATTLVRNAVWCVSNLCRGRLPQPPPLSQLAPFLPQLARLLFCRDPAIVADCCWAVSHLADGDNQRIQAVIDSGACRRLAELLRHADPTVTRAALRAVGNLVTGDDIQTQVLLNCQLLTSLSQLLDRSDESVRKEACWILSNVGAGNRTQIQAVIDANLVPKLVDILRHGEFRTRKEAAWFVANAASGGSPDQARYLVTCGCVQPLCELLTVADVRVVEVALTGIEGILRSGARLAAADGDAEGDTGTTANPFALLVEECGGVDRLEYLQSHENDAVYRRAHAVIDAHFGSEYAAAASAGDECRPLELTAGAQRQQQQLLL